MFGMGTGVAPTLWSPAKIGCTQLAESRRQRKMAMIAGFGSSRCACFAQQLPEEVVKPHGRLGPLRLERVAPLPRAAYRRDGLSRPFRRLEASGVFILERASHLDAFSGYRFLPSLPGGAPGGTAGTRAGSPTRSSRTRVRPPQHSSAHDGYRPNCLTTF